MSHKVGGHSISAKIKGNRAALRMQYTAYVVLNFRVDDYPATAHPLARIDWIARRWWADEHAGSVMPAEYAVEKNRYFEACMKEIDEALLKGAKS